MHRRSGEGTELPVPCPAEYGIDRALAEASGLSQAIGMDVTRKKSSKRCE
ncbi:hypothetical protein GCM10011579_035240 [Streptomyces albiflavescens]|uniref:Uncharacterized protein n=1 Tax=Streptomyces albiflavescens TaxID=1623582 RepID=A0A917Y2H7_9ACTN|nr:hypothetical protein GCM10011579_035240 [Streptomyces albiflavescens]